LKCNSVTLVFEHRPRQFKGMNGHGNDRLE
jgi:hypothetical protein